MRYTVLRPFTEAGRAYGVGDEIELRPEIAALSPYLLAPVAESRSLAIAAAERRRKAEAEERLAAEADARAYGLRHKLVM